MEKRMSNRKTKVTFSDLMKHRILGIPFSAALILSLAGVVAVFVLRSASTESVATAQQPFKIINPSTFSAGPDETPLKQVVLLDAYRSAAGIFVAVARVTDEEGLRQECTYQMTLDPAHDGVTVRPVSRICKQLDSDS